MQNQVETQEAPRPPLSTGLKERQHFAPEEALGAQSDAIDRYPVIVQTFLDAPVRFFKLDFDVETSGIFKRVRTWAIPLPDLASATGYPQKFMRESILLNDKFFLDFCRFDFILDSEGRPQSIMFLAVEMIAALTMKIQTWKTEDPEIRKRARHFQRWVLIILSMIKAHKLLPIRWIRSTDISSKYLPLLSIPSGKDHGKAVLNLAKEEGRTGQTIYRHLAFLRGGNIITSKGIPHTA